MDDNDLTELLRAIVTVFSRQLALFELVRQLGATDEQVQHALGAARKRLGGVPRLAYLQSPNPLNFQGVGSLLENIR
ncbi:MAG TPA: hypothetical protein VJN43_05935 [Bryobacteraceae bacterium]|nr:hypothetical protein [Bryobacteraceae bacterium]